jgi:hypothetical protein
MKDEEVRELEEILKNKGFIITVGGTIGIESKEMYR